MLTNSTPGLDSCLFCRLRKLERWELPFDIMRCKMSLAQSISGLKNLGAFLNRIIFSSVIFTVQISVKSS